MREPVTPHSLAMPKGDITLYTLTNASGASVTLSSLGAGIVYKIDGTASETAAHNARTGDSALFGYVIEIIKLHAAYFIQLRHAFMSLVHTVAYGIVVTFLQGLAHVKHTLLLLYDILGTVVVLLRYAVLDSFKVFHLRITQSINSELLGYMLA